MSKPARGSEGGWLVPFRQGREAGSDHARVNEVSGYESAGEVLIFFSKSAQFRDI